MAYPFGPSWAAVGEQVTAGYAAFFFFLYRTQLSVIAPDSTARSRRLPKAGQAGRGVEVFYSTCADATAERVIGQYASRWSIEVAYRDVRQSLGFEQPQGWCRKTVERTAPMAMLIYSLVIIWFAREGHRHWQPADHAWYATKRDQSFADMLAELKRRSVRRYVLSLPLDTQGPRKRFRILENAVQLAA